MVHKWLLSMCLISFQLFYSYQSIETKLKLVQIIFRHGERTPIYTYPTDWYKEAIWAKYGGLGQLTQKGMRQLFKFGQKLRNHYSAFLNAYYVHSEVDAISTDYDRTIMSTSALLAGMYKPRDYQVFHKDLNWQPIPIKINNERTKKMFNEQPCPKLEQLRKEVYETADFKRLVEDHKDLVNYLQIHTGLNKTFSFNEIWPLGDTLFIEKSNHLHLPEWITKDAYDRILNVSNNSFDFIFRELEAAKLTAGGILNDMFVNIKEKIDGNKKQIQLYGSHDSYLAPMIKLLGLSSHVKQPPCGSALILELRQSVNKYYIQVLWKLESNILKPAIINGCAQLCPYDEFVKIIQNRIVSNFSVSCKMDRSRQEKMFF